MIVQVHMQVLNLEINTPTNTLSSLQLYYDTTESHIRGLAALENFDISLLIGADYY